MLRRIGLGDERRRTVHANRYAILACEARILPARELLRFAPERRLATLVAFAIERQAALTDLAVEMFDKLVGTARRTADRRHEENLLAQAKALAVVARDHAALGRALLEARKAGGSLTDAVERALGWEGLAASVEVAESATGSGTEGDGIEEMIGRHTILRRAATVLFETFRFRSHRGRSLARGRRPAGRAASGQPAQARGTGADRVLAPHLAKPGQDRAGWPRPACL